MDTVNFRLRSQLQYSLRDEVKRSVSRVEILLRLSFLAVSTHNVRLFSLPLNLSSFG